MKMKPTNVIMKTLLSVVILLSSISLQAAENVKVTKNNKSSIVIQATKTMRGDKISIRNQKGEILYREHLDANENYKKIFQFSLFENGVYLISFENNYKVEYYNVIKNDNDIKLLDINQGRFSFKPVVKRVHNLAHVFLTNEGLKDVELRIEDQFGDELSTTHFDKDLIIKKSYDLSRLPSGKYSLIINVGEQSFTKVLNVQ